MINGKDLLTMFKQLVEIHKADSEYPIKVLEFVEESTYNDKTNETKVNITLKAKMKHKKFSNRNTNYYMFTENGNTTQNTTLVEQLHAYCIADKNIQVMHYANPKQTSILDTKTSDGRYHLLISCE